MLQNNVFLNSDKLILVSLQDAQVPLLQGDALDHHEVVQAVLGRGRSNRDPAGLRRQTEIMRETQWWWWGW